MSNFTGSLKSGDLAMTTDILVHELSDFIVHDTKTIVHALNKAGVKVSEADSDEEIGDAIIANIGTNKTLAKALAFIIADANELINNGTPDKKKWTKTVDTIADGLSEIGKGIESNKVAFKDNLIQQITTKAESKGDYKRTILTKNKKSAKAVYYVMGGLAVIGLIIWVIARVQRSQLKDGLSMENGGVIPPIGAEGVVPALTPPISPIPVAPAPIQPVIQAAPTVTTTPPVSNGVTI
jgi:hypothetical protein